MTSKRPNKRTVFQSDSDSEHEGKPGKKRRKTTEVARHRISVQKRNPVDVPKRDPENHKRMLIIPVEALNKSRSQWLFLEVRGPYQGVFFRLINNTIKNRPLCKMLRQLLLKVHDKAMEFKNKRVPEIIQCFDKKRPDLQDAIAIAEEMCRTLFRFRDSDGHFIDLYEENMILPIKEMLFAKELTIDCNKNAETLDRLKSICSLKSVDTTIEELEDVKNGLVYCMFHLAVGLLPCIFSIDVALYPGKVSSYRVEQFSMCETFHEITKWYSSPPRFKSISQNLLYRNRKPASLWVLIPCEVREHLLEHVIEYGLIEMLPEKAKSVLTHWVLGVRKRMRNRLMKGDMRNKIVQYMSGANMSRQLSSDDPRIEGVISAVLENALHSKEFKVFDSEWKDFILNLIKTMDRHQFLDISSRAEIIRDVCESMHPASLKRLSSCFLDSEDDKNMLSHTVHQIFHFTIRFALNTLRHVFRIKKCGRFSIRFDGQMDEEVTDFSTYSRNTSPEIDSTCTSKTETGLESCGSSKSPSTVQVIRPRKTLLPTPVFQNSSPCRRDGFYPGLPPPVYRGSPNPNTFNTRYAVPEPSLFHAYQLEPSDHSEKDVKKSFFNFPSVEETKKRPKTESSSGSLLSEVTDEELSKARALRPPSVSNFTLIDDFEGLPNEWILEYQAALNTNQKLLAELERAKTRLDLISK